MEYFLKVVVGGAMIVAILFVFCIKVSPPYFIRNSIAYASPVVTYYVDSNNGNDLNDGLTVGTPWQTLANLANTELHSGDTVLLKKGGLYKGSLTVNASGVAGAPIVFSVYGDGEKPVISTFEKITGWENKGAGVWEAQCVECSDPVTIVTLDNEQQRMGRYPNIDQSNGGYLTVQSHSDNTIVDNSLNAADWIGAQVVIRKNNWIIDRHRIEESSGHIIQYDGTALYTRHLSSYQAQDGYGYFIQDSPKTLDRYGEWYYNPTTKKIQIYFGSTDPSAHVVNVSTKNNTVIVANQSNIIFSGISFEGSNDSNVVISGSQNIAIENSVIQFSGNNGIDAENNNNIAITNSRIEHTNNNAVMCSSTCTLQDNTISFSGMFSGAGNSGDVSYSGIIINNGSNNILQNNVISDVGYSGIVFGGNNVLIKNNVISRFTMVKDDGSGIYTWTNFPNAPVYSNRNITGNIIEDGLGSPAGAPYAGPPCGVYLDDGTGNVFVADNIFIGNAIGLYLHNTNDISVKSNIFSHNKLQFFIAHDTNVVSKKMEKNSITDNIFHTDILEKNYTITSAYTDEEVSSLVSIDKNYYIYNNKDAQMFNGVNFNQWKTQYSYDANATSITEDVVFVLNKNKTSLQSSIDGEYKDFAGTTYKGGITVSPYSATFLSKVKNEQTIPKSTPPGGNVSGVIGVIPKLEPKKEEVKIIPVETIPVTTVTLDSKKEIVQIPAKLIQSIVNLFEATSVVRFDSIKIISDTVSSTGTIPKVFSPITEPAVKKSYDFTVETPNDTPIIENKNKINALSFVSNAITSFYGKISNLFGK